MPEAVIVDAVRTPIGRAVIAADAETGETLWMWRQDEGERGPRHASEEIVERAEIGPIVGAGGEGRAVCNWRKWSRRPTR